MVNMMRVVIDVLFVFLANAGSGHAKQNESTLPTCGDDPEWKRGDQKENTCKSISKMKAPRINKICIGTLSRWKVKCDLTCGRCCEDEPPTSDLFFLVNKTREEKCAWLTEGITSTWNRRRKQCQRKEVSDLCPKTCGVCGENNFSYRFSNSEGTNLPCSWIKGRSKREAYCEGETNVECKRSCGFKNLSKREKVKRINDRFPCETKTKELGVDINPILFQGVGDDYSDSCELQTHQNYICNYKELTQITVDECGSSGGTLHKLSGSDSCEENHDDSMASTQRNTIYEDIFICLCPTCDVTAAVDGLMKFESFSRCGLDNLDLVV